MKFLIQGEEYELKGLDYQNFQITEGMFSGEVRPLGFMKRKIHKNGQTLQAIIPVGGEWDLTSEVIDSLVRSTVNPYSLKTHKGIVIYGATSKQFTFRCGAHTIWFLHVSLVEVMQRVRDRLAERLPKLREECPYGYHEAWTDRQAVLDWLEITPYRLWRQLADCFLLSNDFVDMSLVHLLEPADEPKAFVWQESPEIHEEYAQQVDIKAAYAQAADKLGWQQILLRNDEEHVVRFISARGIEVEIGGLERVQNIGDNPFAELFEREVWPVLKWQKQVRLVALGAPLMQIGENSTIRYEKIDALGQSVGGFLRARRPNFIRGWKTAMFARAAIKELVSLIYACVPSVLMVLTDSIISTDDVPSRILRRLGFEYHFEAEGLFEAYAPNCYRVGPKLTKNFFVLKQALQNPHRVDYLDYAVVEVKCPALPVVTGLTPQEIRDIIENEVEACLNYRLQDILRFGGSESPSERYLSEST